MRTFSVSICPPADQALRSLSAAGIWAQWDEVLARGNQREIGIVLAALGDALRASGTAAVYDGIAARLADPKTQPGEMDSLVAVLQQAATAPSMGLLLDALNRTAEPTADADAATAQLRTHLRDAVGAMTSGSGGRGPNWALSPALEDAWKGLAPSDRFDDLRMVGQGLASVGAPSGIAALVERATDPAANPLAQAVAYDAIGRVTSIDPVPVLRDALRRPDADPRLRQAVWNGLISIGAADAATVLLNDLTNGPGLTDDQVIQLGTVMTSRGLPAESRKVIGDALSRGQVTDTRLRTLLTTLTLAPTKGEAANAAGTRSDQQGG